MSTDERHTHAGSPGTVRYADLAADDEGIDDDRASLVLLHGLTFDRTMWRPALDVLQRIDPGRRVVTLDLPGHGASPALSSHRGEALVQAVHEAIQAAGLTAPVIVGHSFGAMLATFYAVNHPTRGVVNVDQPIHVEPFLAMLRSLADELRGPGFPAIWRKFEASMHAELLPPMAQDVVRSTCRPDQQLVVSYWAELLDRPAAEFNQFFSEALAALRASALPYLVVAGDEPDSAYRAWLADRVPQARITVFPRSGHFPHLAQPDLFALALASTAHWPETVPSAAAAGR